MAANHKPFNIFEFLGIPVTDDLEAIQKVLDSLPTGKMAELLRNPEFTKIRHFLITKKATPEFYNYVRPLKQVQARKERYQRKKLEEEQRKFLEEYKKHEEEAKKRAMEQEKENKRREEEERKRAMEQEEEAKRQALEKEKEAKIKEQEDKILSLADQFNQVPIRKLSYSFIFSVLFGSFRARLLLYQLLFLAFAVYNIIFNAKYTTSEGVPFLLLSVPCIAIWANLYQYLLLIRTLYLFKKGKFTVGHWVDIQAHFEDSQGAWKDTDDYNDNYPVHWEPAQKTIQFKDDAGIVCKTIVKREQSHVSFYSPFYNFEIPHEKNEPCLIVYDPINRNVNFPIAAVNNPQLNDVAGFRTSVYITKFFYSDLNVVFDLEKQQFTQDNLELRKLILGNAGVLTVMLLLFVVNQSSFSLVLFTIIHIITWISIFFYFI